MDSLRREGHQPAWQLYVSDGHDRSQPLWESPARPAGRRDATQFTFVRPPWESRALTICSDAFCDPVPDGAFMTTLSYKKLAPALLALALIACDETQKQAAPPPPTVTVAQPTQR